MESPSPQAAAAMNEIKTHCKDHFLPAVTEELPQADGSVRLRWSDAEKELNVTIHADGKQAEYAFKGATRQAAPMVKSVLGFLFEPYSI